MSLVFAHRGYSAKFPENTMISFQQAEKVCADGIELDIQMTKDGELVIIHDEKVDRTTNGSGYVKDYLYKDIRTLDAASKYNGNGQKMQIPSLHEFFEWLQQTNIICNIEFKNNKLPYKGMEEKTVELIRQYGLENQIIFSSFNHYSMVLCNQIDPAIETALLFSDGIYRPWMYAKAIKANGIHPNQRLINKEFIRDSESFGIKVRAYTVNDPKKMKLFADSGISALITDDPSLAKSMLNFAP
ncbi:glycerophosphodiester phosphodiesterase [Niallia sp. NCCP-28]|uniref:glycerophosphodiester phosphodiesterase n=1 Tax=Niallia sp. NCCP-28 TaxID=2934712 RepID=UPI0020886417|nr:glycerophosphodiester phosphodiesterase [Niallia sp. NCCP-28]GKU81124.1 glycerophosphoryl diester phosphodiesterase [Niallia sp. NCCP-28]